MSIKDRFIQRPRGNMPADVHPGQQPPISPSASIQHNVDQQRREMAEQEPSAAPSRENTQDAPLFTHGSKITPVTHPSRSTIGAQAGQSSTQSPNDAGRKSVVPG